MKNKAPLYTIVVTLIIICIGLLPESNPDLQPPVKQVNKDTTNIHNKHLTTIKL